MTRCTVLAATNQAYTYLYLREEFSLDETPPELRDLFRGARQVMELDLSERVVLAQADIDMVRRQLAENGYYLQLPPKDDPSGWLELSSKKV